MQAQPSGGDHAAQSPAPGQTAIVSSNRATVQFGPIPASEQAEAAEVMQIFRNPFRPRDLGRSLNLTGSWLWHGYLGPGRLTLLTSQWKSGKTTLVSLLLTRMATGGQLAGLPVAAGRAAVISEESTDDWHRRCQRLGIGDHVAFYCRPFRARPTRVQWLTMIDALLERHEAQALDLVIIDPLSHFLPGNVENSAVGSVEGLLPLRLLLAAGMSVLLLHHPRKGLVQAGQAARGSGALAGHADIVLEMSYVAGPEENDRRRRLRAYSRYDDTRRDLTMELTADGTDYQERESPLDRDLGDTWQVVRRILEDIPMPLTQDRILTFWPDDFIPPKKSALARVLLRGVTDGFLVRHGDGIRNGPYEYQLNANAVAIAQPGDPHGTPAS